MKIIIIEDERLTAEDLKDILLRVQPDAEILTILASVKEALMYLRQNPAPDLIFSDIQLGDGLSFEIFQAIDISVPIIFCTAYNQYALNAFETNGIHYILKPFDEKAIREAFKKYEQLKTSFGYNPHITDELHRIFEKNSPSKPASVLVYHQDKIIPVKLDDIALFYIKNGITHLHTFKKETYFINKTLDELSRLSTELFYRANRQFLVSRNAVSSLSQRLSRKAFLVLNIPFEESILISKEKVAGFLDWLEG